MESSIIKKHSFDRSFLKRGVICGIDEAGRGCIAGPVVAAAVAFDIERLPFISVDDSKKLSPENREELFQKILKACVCWGVGAVGPGNIDRLNIREAAKLAMERAYRVLSLKGCRPSLVLVDGNMPISIDVASRCIVKGDGLSFSIGAASIVAKVIRDRIMSRYHKLFPHYGFASNKGYPTPFHKRAVAQWGPSAIHRLSFRPFNEKKKGKDS